MYTPFVQPKGQTMKTRLVILGLCLVVAFPLLAQKKEDERLANSATVMKELLQGDKGLPTMYSLDQGSLGIQLGSTATDFVLVVMHDKGVDAILNGKTKLGANAAAAAGPPGTHATGY